MPAVPLSKLVSIIWTGVMAVMLAILIVNSVMQLIDYLALSPAEIITSDIADRVTVSLGIPGNVSIIYLPPKLPTNLTVSEKVVCAAAKGIRIPSYHCESTIQKLDFQTHQGAAMKIKVEKLSLPEIEVKVGISEVE